MSTHVQHKATDASGDRSLVPIPPVMSTRNPLRLFGLLFVWGFSATKEMLSLILIIQVLMSVMTLLGYGLLMGDVPLPQANFLVTGATTISLIILGLVIVPQAVAQSKANGSLSWIRTLPVPRWIFLIADLAVYAMIALPGLILSPLVGYWRYGVSFSISWWIVLVAPLVAFMAATVGYSIALLVQPKVAMLLSQLLVFVTLLFSPLSFPAAHMPGWLQEVHLWLPLEPMGQAIRATLMSDTFTMPTRSIIVLAVWTLIATAGGVRALNKRV